MNVSNITCFLINKFVSGKFEWYEEECRQNNGSFMCLYAKAVLNSLKFVGVLKYIRVK